MALDSETFNKDLYNLLKVRGYQPIPLNAQNQRVPVSQEADVIEFSFKKDGKDYGKVWISIEDVKKIVIYYNEDQRKSPSSPTPGLDYDDTWTGLLKHLKSWAQRRQMGFELANKDRLVDDMKQRQYFKKKAKIQENYYPINKKTTYNDAIPSVKIILQHTRNLEEGEQRYRNVARIFIENTDGERFLVPTTRPGLAKVYARHIAEGGLPNDDKWNHIKSICEEYMKLGSFVRATRNKQFNEAAQKLIENGIEHYQNLRKNLRKLASHSGYHSYFENWTPILMEDEIDESINELFVQEMIDPRIENAMPILARLKSKSSNTVVEELEEWADSVIHEKLGLEEEHINEISKKPNKKIRDQVKISATETLDVNQKKVGQLGPTEKVGKKGAIGKLVGESLELDKIIKLSGILK
jgi:hypothetical protein